MTDPKEQDIKALKRELEELERELRISVHRVGGPFSRETRIAKIRVESVRGQLRSMQNGEESK